jgi:hypothetical protein
VLYSVLDVMVVVVHCGEKENRPRAESTSSAGTQNWCVDLGIGARVFLCCGLSMYGMMSAVGGLGA